MEIICTKCAKSLDLAHFNKHKRDGYSQPCKDCKRLVRKPKTEADKIRAKEWKKTPTGKKANSRHVQKYYQENREAVLTYRHDYYTSLHPEKNVERYMKWNAKTKHLRRLTKAFAIIAQEALKSGLQDSNE